MHPSSFDGSETRTITLNFGDGRKAEFSGQDYLFTNALPNFYFLDRHYRPTASCAISASISPNATS